MGVTLTSHQIGVRLLEGWEGEIYRRKAQDDMQTFPILHMANFPLPAIRGDFGSGVVELMKEKNVFISLFEYGPESLDKKLFQRRGIPTGLSIGDFSPVRLHRIIKGQLGYQSFFQESMRAFCLYIVLGGKLASNKTIEDINAILSSISISQLGN